jgi:hypothetical protein
LSNDTTVGFRYPSIGEILIDLVTIAPTFSLYNLLKRSIEMPRKPEARRVGLRKHMPAKFTLRVLLSEYCSLLNSCASSGNNYVRVKTFPHMNVYSNDL